MLKHRQIFFHIKRKAMSNVYITSNELIDLVNNLSGTELKLYSLLHNSAMLNPTVDYFEDINLAKELQVSDGTVRNAKSALKQKGYALIIKFKDEDNNPCLRVIVGKEQVNLYNLGIKCEITNSKAFNRLLSKFPIMDSSLTAAQREEAVKEFNKYYLDHIEEFK